MHRQINSKVVPLRPKKRISSKYLLAGAMAAVVLTLMLLFNRYYFNTYTVVEGTVQKSLYADALIIKKETVITSPADGKLQLLVKPGERVRVGTPLFMVITDLDQKEKYEKQISELQGSIKDLQNDLNSHIPLNVINKSIDDTTKKLKEAIAQGQFDKVRDLKSELARLMKEKQKQIQSGQTNIKAMEKTVDELKKKLSSVELLVNAPEAGMVSFNIDGYENVLTVDCVKNISSSQLQSIKGQEPEQVIPSYATVRRPVLKIVDNFSYYMAVDIKNATLKEGKNYNIVIKTSDFSKKIPAELVDIHENDRVGIFLIEKDLPEIINFRRVDVEIITQTATGSIIPLSGIVNVDGSEGVYLLDGRNRVFRAVKIIASDGSNAVVEGLKLGDRILIDKKGLTWKH
ncbi:MAG TPA: hypothetical protein GXX35_09105 [Thermoanaerobacterales bacterium]|nr:hypothetical protein [Thermoanaerobacterales bacterium]